MKQITHKNIDDYSGKKNNVPISKDNLAISLEKQTEKAKLALREAKILDTKGAIGSLTEHLKKLGVHDEKQLLNIVNEIDSPELENFNNYAKKNELYYNLTHDNKNPTEESNMFTTMDDNGNTKLTQNAKVVTNYLTLKAKLDAYKKKQSIPSQLNKQGKPNAPSLQPDIPPVNGNTPIKPLEPTYPILDYTKVIDDRFMGKSVPTPLERDEDGRNIQLMKQYLEAPEIFKPDIARLDKEDIPQYDARGERTYENDKVLRKWSFASAGTQGKLHLPEKEPSIEDVYSKGGTLPYDQGMNDILNSVVDIEGTKVKFKKDPDLGIKELTSRIEEILDIKMIKKGTQKYKDIYGKSENNEIQPFMNPIASAIYNNMPTGITQFIHNTVNMLTGNTSENIDDETVNAVNQYIDQYNLLKKLSTAKKYGFKEDFDYANVEKETSWLKKTLLYGIVGMEDYFDQIISRGVLGKLSEDKRIIRSSLSSKLKGDNFEAPEPWALIKEALTEQLRMRNIDASTEEYAKIIDLEDSWDNRIPAMSFEMGKMIADMSWGGFKAGSKLTGTVLNTIRTNRLKKITNVTEELVKDAVWMDKSRKPLNNIGAFIKHYTNPVNFKTALITPNGQKMPSLYQTLGSPIDHPLTLTVGGAASYILSLDPTMSSEKLIEKMQSMAILGMANVGMGMAIGQFARMAVPVYKRFGNAMLDPKITNAMTRDIAHVGFAAGNMFAQPVGAMANQYVSSGGFNMTPNDVISEMIYGALFQFNDASHLNARLWPTLSEISYRRSNPLRPTTHVKTDVATGKQIFVENTNQLREPTAYEYFQNRAVENKIPVNDIKLKNAVDMIATDESTISSYLKKTNRKDTKQARENITKALMYLKETKGDIQIKGGKLGFDSQGRRNYAEYDKDGNILLTNEPMGNSTDRALNNKENMLNFLTHEGGHTLFANEYKTNPEFKASARKDWQALKERVEEDESLLEEVYADKDLMYAFEQSGLIEGSDKSPDTQINEFMALLIDASQSKFRNKLQDIVLKGDKKNFADRMISSFKSTIGIKDPNNVYNEVMKNLFEGIMTKQTINENTEAAEPLNMTIESLKSNEFKEWFGDWENDRDNASKITDDNGLPKMVFHGTQTSDISEFNKNRERKTGTWTGVYVTNDPKYAESYANYNRNYEEKDNKFPQIYPLYASIKNPLHINEGESLPDVMYDILEVPKFYRAKVHKGEIAKMFRRIINLPVTIPVLAMTGAISAIPKLKNTKTGSESKIVFQRAIELFKKGGSWNNDNLHYASASFLKEEIVDGLKNKGYDGVVYNEGNEIVVFDPTQIKSAIGNKGTFDKSDPNILNMTINTLKASQLMADIPWTPEQYARATEDLSVLRTNLANRNSDMYSNMSNEHLMRHIMRKYNAEIGDIATPDNISKYIKQENMSLENSLPMYEAEVERNFKKIKDGLFLDELYEGFEGYEDKDNPHGEDQYDSKEINRKVDNIAKVLGFSSIDAYKRMNKDIDLRTRTTDIFNKLITVNDKLEQDNKIPEYNLYKKAARIANIIDNSERIPSLHINLSETGKLNSMEEHESDFAFDGTRINQYLGKFYTYNQFASSLKQDFAKMNLSTETSSLINEILDGRFKQIASVNRNGKADHIFKQGDIRSSEMSKTLKYGYFVLPKLSGGLTLYSGKLHEIAKNKELSKLVAQEMQWANFWKFIGSDATWKYDGKAKDRMNIQSVMDPMKMYERYVEGKKVEFIDMLKGTLSNDFSREVTFKKENMKYISEVGQKMKEYFRYIENEKGIETDVPISRKNLTSHEMLYAAIEDVFNWTVNSAGTNRIQKIKENEYDMGKIADKYTGIILGHAPLRLSTIEQLSYFEPEVYNEDGKLNDGYLNRRKWVVRGTEDNPIIHRKIAVMWPDLFKDDAYMTARFKKEASDGIVFSVNEDNLKSLQSISGAKDSETVIKYNQAYVENGNGVIQKSMEYGKQFDEFNDNAGDKRYKDLLAMFGNQVSAIAAETAFKNHDAYNTRETDIPELGITLVQDQVTIPLYAYKTGDLKKQADPELLDIVMKKTEDLLATGNIPSWTIMEIPLTGPDGLSILSTSHGIVGTKDGSGHLAMDNLPVTSMFGEMWKGNNGNEAYEALKTLGNNRITTGINNIKGLYSLYSVFSPGNIVNDELRTNAARGVQILRESIANKFQKNESDLRFMLSIGGQEALNILDSSVESGMLKTDKATLAKLTVLFDNFIVGDNLNEAGAGTQLSYMIRKEFEAASKLKTTGMYGTYVPMTEGEGAMDRMIAHEIARFDSEYRGERDENYESKRNRLVKKLSYEKANLMLEIDPETGLTVDGSPVIFISRNDYEKLRRTTIKNNVPILGIGSKVFAQRTPSSSADNFASFIIGGIHNEDGTIAMNSFTGAKVFGMDFDKDGISLKIMDKDFNEDVFIPLWNYINENGHREGAWKNKVQSMDKMQKQFNSAGNVFTQMFGLEPEKRYTQPQHSGYYDTVIRAQEVMDITIATRNNIAQALENMHEDFHVNDRGDFVANIGIPLNSTGKMLNVDLRQRNRFADFEGKTFNVQSNVDDLAVEHSVDTWNQRAYNPIEAMIDLLIDKVDGKDYKKYTPEEKNKIRKVVSYFFNHKAGAPFNRKMKEIDDLQNAGITYHLAEPKASERGTWKNLLKQFRSIDKPMVNEEVVSEENTGIGKPNAIVNYKGGFENTGKGTPMGDGKDKAMREVANGFIGEIEPAQREKSSTWTTLQTMANKIGGIAWNNTNKITASVIKDSGSTKIVLARNKELKGQPLQENTKIQIRANANMGADFVVGDMPDVDSQFIDYLDEIGAEYTIYHTGNEPRIKKQVQTTVTDKPMLNKVSNEKALPKPHIIPREDEFAPLMTKIETLKDLHKQLVSDVSGNRVLLSKDMGENLATSKGLMHSIDNLGRKLLVARVNNKANTKGEIKPYVDGYGNNDDPFSTFKEERPFGKPILEKYAGTIYNHLFNAYKPKTTEFSWNFKDFSIKYKNGYMMHIAGNKVTNSIMTKDLFKPDGTVAVDWIPLEVLNAQIHNLHNIDKGLTNKTKNELIAKGLVNVVKTITDDPVKQGLLWTQMGYDKYPGYSMDKRYRNSSWSDGTIMSPTRFPDTKYVDLVQSKYKLNTTEEAKMVADGEVAFNMFDSIKFAKDAGIEPLIVNGFGTQKLSDHLIDKMNEYNKISIDHEDRDGMNMSTISLARNIYLKDFSDMPALLKNLNKGNIDPGLLKKVKALGNIPLSQIMKKDYQNFHDTVLEPLVRSKWDKFAEDKDGKYRKPYSDEEWETMKEGMLDMIAPHMVNAMEDAFKARGDGNYGYQSVRLLMLSNIADTFSKIRTTAKYAASPILSNMRNYTLLKSTIENEIYSDLSNIKKFYKPEEVITSYRGWKNGKVDEGVQLETVTALDVIDNATMIQSALPFLAIHTADMFIPMEDFNLNKDLVLTVIKDMVEQELMGFKKPKKVNRDKFESIRDIPINENTIDISEIKRIVDLEGMSELDQIVSDTGFSGMEIVTNGVIVKGGSSNDVNNSKNIKDAIKGTMAHLSFEQQESLAKFVRIRANFNTLANILHNMAFQVETSNKKLNTKDPARYKVMEKSTTDLMELANRITDITPLKLQDLTRKMMITDGQAIEFFEQELNSRVEGSLENNSRKYFEHKAIMNKKYKAFNDYMFTNGRTDEPTQAKLFDTVTQQLKTDKVNTGKYNTNMGSIFEFIRKNIELSMNEAKNIEDLYKNEDGTSTRKKGMAGIIQEYETDPNFVSKMTEQLYFDAMQNVMIRNEQGSSYYDLLHDMDITGFEKRFDELTGYEVATLEEKAKLFITKKIHQLTNKANVNDKTIHFGVNASMDIIKGIDARKIEKEITIDKMLATLRPDIMNNEKYFSYNINNFGMDVASKVREALVGVEHVYQHRYNDNPDNNMHARIVALGKLSRVMNEKQLFTSKVDKNSLFEGQLNAGDYLNTMVRDENGDTANLVGRLVGTLDVVKEAGDETTTTVPTLVMHDDSEGGRNIYTIEKDNLVNVLTGNPYGLVKGKLEQQLRAAYEKPAKDLIDFMKSGYRIKTQDNEYRLGIRNTDLDIEVMSERTGPNAFAKNLVNYPEYRNGIGKINAKTAGGTFTKLVDSFLNFNAKTIPLSVYLGGMYVGIGIGGIASIPFLGPIVGGSIATAAGMKFAKRLSHIGIQNYISNLAFGNTMPTARWASKRIDKMGKFMFTMNDYFAGLTNRFVEFGRTLKSAVKGGAESAAVASVRATEEGVASQYTEAGDVFHDVTKNLKNWRWSDDFLAIHKNKKAIKAFEAIQDNIAQVNSLVPELTNLSTETLVDGLKLMTKESLTVDKNLFLRNNNLSFAYGKTKNQRGFESQPQEAVPLLYGLSKREHNNLVMGYMDLLGHYLSGGGWVQSMEVKSAIKSYSLAAYRIKDVMDARKGALDIVRDKIVEKANAEGRQLTKEEEEFVSRTEPDLTPWLRTAIEKSMVWKSIGNYIRTSQQSTVTGRLLTMFGNFSKESGLNSSTYAVKRASMYNTLMDGFKNDKEFVNFMDGLGIPVADWYLNRESTGRFLAQGTVINAAKYGAGSVASTLTAYLFKDQLSALSQFFWDSGDDIVNALTVGDGVRVAAVGMLQFVLDFLLSNANNTWDLYRKMGTKEHKSALNRISSLPGDMLSAMGTGYLGKALLEPTPQLAVMGAKLLYDREVFPRKTQVITEKEVNVLVYKDLNKLLLPITMPWGTAVEQGYDIVDKSLGKKR